MVQVHKKTFHTFIGPAVLEKMEGDVSEISTPLGSHVGKAFCTHNIAKAFVSLSIIYVCCI